MYKVFLAHSSKNMDMVVSLVEMLHSAKISVYVAEFNPEPGEYLDDKIKRNLQESDVLLALFTCEGINSDWVWREIRYALENHIMVIPLIENRIEIPHILKDIDCLIFDRDESTSAYETVLERISILSTRKRELITKDAQPAIPEYKNVEVALIVLSTIALFILVVLVAKASRG